MHTITPKHKNLFLNTNDNSYDKKQSLSFSKYNMDISHKIIEEKIIKIYLFTKSKISYIIITDFYNKN